MIQLFLLLFVGFLIELFVAMMDLFIRCSSFYTKSFKQSTSIYFNFWFDFNLVVLGLRNRVNFRCNFLNFLLNQKLRRITKYLLQKWSLLRAFSS